MSKYATKHPTLPQGEERKEQVRNMFNRIAQHYDFLNHFLSAGIDKSWRKKTIRMVAEGDPQTILDIATGTADLAIVAARNTGATITGLDISDKMLAIGKQKINKLGLTQRIQLIQGDSEQLPMKAQQYDAVMVAFGVRNFANLKQGLSEIYRVLNPGGKVYILEFSQPQHFPVKQLYNFYSNKILPFIGKIISHDKSAYTYLPTSVNEFPHGEAFLKILTSCQFKQPGHRPLTMGIASIYTGTKPEL